MPVSEVPSPYDKKLSYAEYFEKQFEESLKDVYIEAEFIYQNKMNKKSSYAKLIKIALDNVEKIKSILNKYRKEPLAKSWLPIAVYCDKCKKEKPERAHHCHVSYECE